MKHPLQHLVYVILLAALVTPNTVWAQAKAAHPIDGVIGKLQSFDGKSLDVQTPSGVVHVIVKEPLTTYKQIPSDLSHVAAASYIGVASADNLLSHLYCSLNAADGHIDVRHRQRRGTSSCCHLQRWQD